MSSDAHARWSERHGGLDAHGSAWVSGWVRLTDAVARPLAARGVHPHVVTLAGVLVTAVVPLLAAVGSPWSLVAVPVLVAGAVLDGVDGALASRTGTASAWGAVVDGLADRASDLLLVTALVLLGAPLWLGALLAVATLLQEGTRAAARAAGQPGVGAVTVSERPTRVIVAAFAVLLCGLEPLARDAGVGVLPDLDAGALATAAAALGLALTLVGLVQVLVAARHDLRPDRPGPPRSGPTG